MPPASTAQLPSPATLGDNDLIARAQTGDRLAFAELYRRFKGDALRFIRHAARHTQDADDILQEVFVEVAHSLKSFQGRSSFQGWLRAVCVRTAMRHMKRRYRQMGEEDANVDEKAARTLLSTDDPAHQAEQRDRAARVKAMLENIAPKKRMVLLLHDFEGVSPKDISEMVGAPVLTVRTRLFYARRELTALASADPLLAGDLAALKDGGGR